MGFNFTIENLDVGDIVSLIDSEIKRLNTEEAQTLAPQITAENIDTYKTKISSCITILEQAQLLRKSLISSGNMTEESINGLLESDISKNVTSALKNGLIIIDNLQRQAGKGVDYKIVIAGKQLYEANIPLEEILKEVKTTFRDKDGGFSLKLTYTKQQMQNAIKMIQEDQASSIQDNVLSKMKAVQITDEKVQKVWDVLRSSKNRLSRISKKKRLLMAYDQDEEFWSKDFIKLVNGKNQKEFTAFVKGLTKAQLSDIKMSSHKINEGQLIEAFYEYALNQSEYMDYDVYKDSELYVNLFEKSKNVLGHQYGGDAGNYQIKALNANSQQAIATIATISNVLRPLKDIQESLTTFEGDIAGALEQAFTSKGGTDRGFKEDSKQVVIDQVKKALS